MAAKTLIRITSPPFIISTSQPWLSSTLLELVRSQVATASKSPLQPQLQAAPLSGEQQQLSEQAILVLTLIDALPFLPTDVLEEWLPLTADSLGLIQDQDMLETCRQRFWGVLSSGEMDVDRAAICVAWWTGRGGRDMVLYGGPYMTGGLEERSKL